ncbi:MAG: hypothetical protein ABIZ71_02575 [Gemmatimonadales bacterium]
MKPHAVPDRPTTLFQAITGCLGLIAAAAITVAVCWLGFVVFLLTFGGPR